MWYKLIIKEVNDSLLFEAGIIFNYRSDVDVREKGFIAFPLLQKVLIVIIYIFGIMTLIS